MNNAETKHEKLWHWKDTLLLIGNYIHNILLLRSLMMNNQGLFVSQFVAFAQTFFVGDFKEFVFLGLFTSWNSGDYWISWIFRVVFLEKLSGWRVLIVSSSKFSLIGKIKKFSMKFKSSWNYKLHNKEKFNLWFLIQNSWSLSFVGPPSLILHSIFFYLKRKKKSIERKMIINEIFIRY